MPLAPPRPHGRSARSVLPAAEFLAAHWAAPAPDAHPTSLPTTPPPPLVVVVSDALAGLSDPARLAATLRHVADAAGGAIRDAPWPPEGAAEEEEEAERGEAHGQQGAGGQQGSGLRHYVVLPPALFFSRFYGGVPEVAELAEAVVQARLAHALEQLPAEERRRRAEEGAAAAAAAAGGGGWHARRFLPPHLIEEGLEEGGLLRGVVHVGQRGGGEEAVVQVGGGGGGGGAGAVEGGGMALGALLRLSGRQAMGRCMHGDRVAGECKGCGWLGRACFACSAPLLACEVWRFAFAPALRAAVRILTRPPSGGPADGSSATTTSDGLAATVAPDGQQEGDAEEEAAAGGETAAAADAQPEVVGALEAGEGVGLMEGEPEGLGSGEGALDAAAALAAGGLAGLPSCEVVGVLAREARPLVASLAPGAWALAGMEAGGGWRPWRRVCAPPRPLLHAAAHARSALHRRHLHSPLSARRTLNEAGQRSTKDAQRGRMKGADVWARRTPHVRRGRPAQRQGCAEGQVQGADVWCGGGFAARCRQGTSRR